LTRLRPRVRSVLARLARPQAQEQFERAQSVERAEINRLADEVATLRESRSPSLWNEIRDPIPESLGTVTDAVRALAADEQAFSAALDAAVARFSRCAQGPLLTALGAERVRALIAQDPLPVPPPPARERYFEGDDMSYWISGLGDRLLLEDIARRLDRPLAKGSRVLDFGSSSGRVLRHFANAVPEIHGYGIDLGRTSVQWARQHLQPAVVVLQGTVLPNLPFPDGYFDCIYAGSVFTHIDDFEEAWLLELSRVLSPAGFALLTFHPERTWNEMGSNPEHWVRHVIGRGPHRLDPGGIEPVSMDLFEQPMPADRVVLTLTALTVNNANVFHSDRWIRDRWGRLLELQFVIPRAHDEYQDAAVLTRRG
jgi:SAM-dependent methyltransferase